MMDASISERESVVRWIIYNLPQLDAEDLKAVMDLMTDKLKKEP